MRGTNIPSEKKEQLQKFKDAAREIETDDDEARFDEKLRRVAKAPAKPDEKKS